MEFIFLSDAFTNGSENDICHPLKQMSHILEVRSQSDLRPLEGDMQRLVTDICDEHPSPSIDNCPFTSQLGIGLFVPFLVKCCLSTGSHTELSAGC